MEATARATDPTEGDSTHAVHAGDAAHAVHAGDAVHAADPVHAADAADAAVRRWLQDLSAVGADPSRTEAEIVDLLRDLEELKAAAAAAQARLAVALEACTRSRHARAGLPAAEQGRGVAAQVALARRDSPVKGGRHLGLAKALVGEMPHTHAALSAGAISEWRATLLGRETACLSVEHRMAVDRELCADPDRLEGWGDRRLVAEAKRIAYRLDPLAAVRRARKAARDRRVTLRPAPDTMTYLTALLPVAQGVACLAALERAAVEVRAAGDDRGRGQVMADTLAARLTGQDTAEAVPVTVDLVISDQSLLGGAAEPGTVLGYGPVPAQWVRDLVADAIGRADGSHVWLRRIFARPDDGALVALESRRRRFPRALGRLLMLRDGGSCRTPWCDAPVRHLDHVVPQEQGGPTTAANGQGLCEACNYRKQVPGWRARAGPEPDRPHTVVTIAPAGHVYRSQAPPVAAAAPAVTTDPGHRVDLRWPMAS